MAEKKHMTNRAGKGKIVQGLIAWALSGWIAIIVMIIFIATFIIFAIYPLQNSFLPWGLHAVFSGILVICLYLALLPTLRYRWYGNINLNIGPATPGVGGQVSGSFCFEKGLGDGERYQVGIKCFHKEMETDNRGNEYMVETAVYKNYAGGSQITTDDNNLYFCFDIPDDIPPTQGDGDGSFLWKIELKIDAPGLDYQNLFEIPISDKPAFADLKQLNGAQIARSQGLYSGGNVFVARKEVGTEIYLPPGTIKKSWLVPGVVISFVWLINFIDVALMTGIWGAGIMLGVSVITMFGVIAYLRLWSPKWILLGKDSIYCFERFWGLFSRRDEMKFEDIVDVRVINTRRSPKNSNDLGDQLFFEARDGRTIHILSGELEDRYESERVMSIVNEYLMERESS